MILLHIYSLPSVIFNNGFCGEISEKSPTTQVNFNFLTLGPIDSHCCTCASLAKIIARQQPCVIYVTPKPILYTTRNRIRSLQANLERIEFRGNKSCCLLIEFTSELLIVRARYLTQQCLIRLRDRKMKRWAIRSRQSLTSTLLLRFELYISEMRAELFIVTKHRS